MFSVALNTPVIPATPNCILFTLIIYNVMAAHLTLSCASDVLFLTGLLLNMKKSKKVTYFDNFPIAVSLLQ